MAEEDKKTELPQSPTQDERDEEDEVMDPEKEARMLLNPPSDSVSPLSLFHSFLSFLCFLSQISKVCYLLNAFLIGTESLTTSFTLSCSFFFFSCFRMTIVNSILFHLSLVHFVML